MWRQGRQVGSEQEVYTITHERQDDGKKKNIQQETRERLAQYIGGKHRCTT